MAKKKITPAESTPVEARLVNGFLAENADKWDRAIHGTILQEGALKGGVGEEATPEAKLAEYDRLGGYITKDGRKVKNGAFYDPKKNQPIENPKPVMEFRVDGDVVEIPVGGEVPVEVQAAEIATEKKASRKKAKPSIEDEE